MGTPFTVSVLTTYVRKWPVALHVSYHEEEYESAEQCLAAMRDFVGLGWGVSYVSGPRGNTYLVRYRLDRGGAVPPVPPLWSPKPGGTAATLRRDTPPRETQ